MQRAADRDDRRDRRAPRAKRLSRALVGATAVPVVLLAAGCSSGSDDGGGDSGGAENTAAASGSPSASPSPTVRAAAYGKLPGACAVLSKKSLSSLVPKAAASGKEGKSNDTQARTSCSWSSLDDNGVKGSQFRWLSVSLLRFESDATRGEGDKLAEAYYQKQVGDAQSVEGAKNATARPLTGTGDQATAVGYDLKKKEGAFKQQTVVARVENVVITLDYNGAGLAGEKTPDADGLAGSAKKAAGEVVAAVASANGDTVATPGDAPSKSATASGSAKPSASGGSSASPSPAKSAKASESAADQAD
ncbi:DUF3558 domain-containing protein [Streptomyces sp. NPDC005840]|jgi:hypothetical protein|uniref:DUF3558 domain-containing protein n=1 Tax=unclassified Streptomyces TaxID=2593676 RepID=UPI0033E54F1C